MNKPDLKKINVVILAAGKGTRIKKVASGTPKALLEIAGIPALVLIMRRLIKQGFRTFTLVVNKDNKKQIEDVVKNAFAGVNLNLEAIIQPQSKGPAHAFFYGLKKVNLDNDTLLCLSDTLFDEDLPVGYDWVGTSLAKGVGKWCWVETTNKKVINFFDKIQPPKHVEEVLIGLYYFNNSKFVYDELAKIIRSNSKRAEGEFQLSQILDLYKSKHNIKSFIVNSWIDCGTEENYFNAQKIYTNHRHFNSIIIKNGNSNCCIVKKGNQNKIQNEIDWFNLAVKQNRLMVPKIRKNSKNSYKMNFINDPLLSSLYLYNPININDFLKIIRKLYSFAVKYLWRDGKKYKDINIKNDCQLMYENKPFERLMDWEMWRTFKSIRAIKINGKNYSKLYDLLSKALKLSSLNNHKPVKSLIHGDFHFGNIFYNKRKQSFVFIDPRGRFGNSSGMVGDIYYDLAKLRHSYHGMYDAIVEGLYVLDRKSKGNFVFKVGPVRSQYIKKIDQFISSSGFDISVVKSIELGILLSLIPFHQESQNNQLAFFLQAVMLAQELV